MKKRVWNMKCLFFAIMIGLVSICLLLTIFSVVKDNERKNCYERLGREFGVAPTYSALKIALYEQLSKSLEIGMSREEVGNVLSQIAPYVVIARNPARDNNLAEEIVLKTCRYTENGFYFMAIYDQDGDLLEFRWIYPD